MKISETMPEHAEFLNDIRRTFGMEVGGYASYDGAEFAWLSYKGVDLDARVFVVAVVSSQEEEKHATPSRKNRR